MQYSAQAANTNKERRSGSERRAQAGGLDFPFIDSHGHLVTEERRKNNRRGSKTNSRNTGQSTS